MPEDLRGRLREARHATIEKLAQSARAHGAATILLAGDTFDTETPAPAILRQAFAAMGEDQSVRWIILPGNHDSLQADELWSAAAACRPNNVILATEPVLTTVEPGVAVLPAPCPTRRPGRDLTDWMTGVATGDGVLRIGLAHGAIRDFSEDGGAAEIIAPDRSTRSGLDYLALGDWHGPTRVNDRTWYSGAPEPDRFKHPLPGQAFVVSIEASGAMPEVHPVQTGTFEWRMVDLHMLAGDDPAASLSQHLPIGSARRQTLLRIAAAGRVRLSVRSQLSSAIEAVEPEFAYATLDDSGLATECESDDLDLIDRAGTLRQAADALLAESVDETLPTEDREIARAALARLFSHCQAVQP